MSDLGYWTDEKVAALEARKGLAFAKFRREYPGVVGELLCLGLQSKYWNQGFTAAESALDQLDEAASDVKDLESRLNDAYYERDAARDDLARAEASLANLRGAK
jgi:outer membrane murein-binding lipoprotein Lpp